MVDTYKLIQEWIIDHSNDWYTFKCKSDRRADHWISMYLSSALAPSLCDPKRRHIVEARREVVEGEEGAGGEDGKERGGHTKLVVPSIGLLSAQFPALEYNQAYSTIR